ncbi:hypothetical protein [Devosia sp. 63-57]|uniref:hypothetical protein n=1 Tax=Devosia sp. 63-57 TaxID=1895751 RepID=UPI00086F52B7|nr:hypothetical protein [Devosia sp. 63-57]ODT50264.1 MAG: hypothetical protein ABS74_04935 [Pelagibacterium sp. SCN 63-126]ODU83011.1 MAG: hypothetical protein ABT14_16130 [Pelagibacterium sp. SCN 63-17]OJX45008.1 MAG: hypothetical protein BGO80_03935 [Devosia sp. 63-57]
MRVSTKVEPIARDIAFIVAQDLSPEARSRALADYAGEQIAEADRQNRAALGTAVHREVFVDGRRAAALTSVRPDGVIVAEFDLVNDALEWIGRQLVLTSPVLTGAYARNHVMFADGTEVTSKIPDAAEYIFVNMLPYARKIEAGLSDQAPDGVYQAVAVVAARRFGNVARVLFGYRTVAGSRSNKSAERQPAIIVRLGR